MPCTWCTVKPHNFPQEVDGNHYYNLIKVSQVVNLRGFRSACLQPARGTYVPDSDNVAHLVLNDAFEQAVGLHPVDVIDVEPHGADSADSLVCK